ncbi:hypothetical protein BsWGS_11929 [Bradybaena similaris]
MQPLVFLLFVAVINFGVCQQPTCDPGWEQHEGYCYYYGGAAVSYGEAMAICRAQGSLAEIPTLGINDFLTPIARRHGDSCVWVGGTDILIEGVFQWASGANAFNFTNWGNGEPSHNNGQDCLQLFRDYNYKWDDTVCTKNCYFFCEQPF